MFEQYIERHRIARKEDLPIHISELLKAWQESKGFDEKNIPRLTRDGL